MLVGFGFQGGASVSPEFAALLVGLTTCTAALIGEIVRGGILAVDKGQSEAAAALGLSRAKILRLVVLPQALRVIIPPTTSQFLNLLKNSSLAVAIGYPDLISITNTTLNQTGQAIEAIALAMAAYLVVSLGVSLAMNVYNAATLRRGGRARMTAMARLTASIRRAPMFRDRTNAIATAILGAAIAYAGFRFVRWASGQRHLVAPPGGGLGGVPRRAGRWGVLGGHRRAFSLHAVRRLSVRRAVAAGRRLRAVRRRCTGRARYGPGGTGGCSACGLFCPPLPSCCCAAGCSDSRTFRANSGEACR